MMLALAVVVAAAAAALPAAQSRPAQQAPAFVQWSVDGQLVGQREAAPDAARDFHAHWTTGGAVLVWTKNGSVNSDAISSPSGANDFRVVWNRRATKFRAAFWTRDGSDLQPIPIAPGSNDLFARLNGGGVFDSAFWSRRGKVLRPIVPAPGANDVRLELKSSLR
jgi:hypothetical protein